MGMKKTPVHKMRVYCGFRPGSTTDHVLARGFVGIRNRGNLPKVPCCSDCDNAKAGLDHHLTTVLPFGALHRDAARHRTKNFTDCWPMECEIRHDVVEPTLAAASEMRTGVNRAGLWCRSGLTGSRSMMPQRASRCFTGYQSLASSSIRRQ